MKVKGQCFGNAVAKQRKMQLYKESLNKRFVIFENFLNVISAIHFYDVNNS